MWRTSPCSPRRRLRLRESSSWIERSRAGECLRGDRGGACCSRRRRRSQARDASRGTPRPRPQRRRLGAKVSISTRARRPRRRPKGRRTLRTAWPASITTGAPSARIFGMERMSTTRFRYPKELPRSVRSTRSLPARHLCRAPAPVLRRDELSRFFRFRTLPVRAAARSSRVRWQRYAGICTTSSTSAPRGRRPERSCTSDRTGSPVSLRTFSKTRSPASSPDPGSSVLEERLSLRNELLKTIDTPVRSEIRARASATRRQRSSLSITHGPADRGEGRPRAEPFGRGSPPDSRPLPRSYRIMSFRGWRRFFLVVVGATLRVLQRGPDESGGTADAGRPGRERNSGWNWHAHEPRMRRQLHDLHEPLLGPASREQDTRCFERLLVALVELVAVAMALEDRRRAVRAARLRGRHEARISYAPSRIVAPLSTIERCSGRRSITGSARSRAGTRSESASARPKHVARELHRGAPGDRGRCRDTALRARAPSFTARSLPVDPARPESAGHEDAVRGGEQVLDDVRLNRLRVHPQDVDLRVVLDAREQQRLRRRTCTRPSGRRTCRTARSAPSATRRVAAQERLPVAEVDACVVREAQLLADDACGGPRSSGSRALRRSSLDVGRGITAPRLDVAVERDLFLDALRDGAIRAAHDHVGLDTDLRSSRTECCVGFVFSSPAAPMNGKSVRCRNSSCRGPLRARSWRIGFQERQARCRPPSRRPPTITTSRAISVGELRVMRVLDLVRDVRDDLDRPAQIVAAPLHADHVLVDLPGRDVVAARLERLVEEAPRSARGPGRSPHRRRSRRLRRAGTGSSSPGRR